MKTTTTPAAPRAFSLAELMVVIVIIGLLGIRRPQRPARLAQAGRRRPPTSTRSRPRRAVPLDNNRWPETVEELVTKDDRGTSYLKGERAPTDAWNNEFVLEVDGSELLIWSMGQDGSEGGEGLDMDFNNRMIRNKEVK